MSCVTIVGLNYFFGPDVFKVGQIVYGIKDLDNTYDSEAIKIVSEADVPYGYIANSIYTVAKGCKSAGRIYDTFEEKLKMKVLFIVRNVVIAEIIE